jgi:hypothetical protein
LLELNRPESGSSTCARHGVVTSRKKDNLMTGHQWTRPVCSAVTRSGRPCRRRVVMRPDGRPHTVCANHGGLSLSPAAPLSERGKQIISASTKRTWERYRARKVAGLAVWPVGRKKRQVPSPRAKWEWKETPEASRKRIVDDLRKRFPTRDWDDPKAPSY